MKEISGQASLLVAPMIFAASLRNQSYSHLNTFKGFKGVQVIKNSKRLNTQLNITGDVR